MESLKGIDELGSLGIRLDSNIKMGFKRNI
jgi:hypothetical protein